MEAMMVSPSLRGSGGICLPTNHSWGVEPPSSPSPGMTNLGTKKSNWKNAGISAAAFLSCSRPRCSHF